MLEPADLERAKKRLEGAIYDSPCPYSQTLSELSGARCFVKLENLQMTGSFKERGAANLLLQLDADERARGVIAASAGNHGLAVAFHAARLGIPAVIVMPEWAPLIKVTSSRRYGAEVILHGVDYDEAYGRAREVQAERGLAFVHPFDDERVIAGQGTLGLELLAQRPEMDAVLVPVGGGGLIAGVALAVKSHRPEVQVIGVQAAALPAMKIALEGRERVRLPPASTIADGIAVRQVGELTLALARRHVDRVVTVSEEELANAILLLLEIEKTVVEGAGGGSAAPRAGLPPKPRGRAQTTPPKQRPKAAAYRGKEPHPQRGPRSAPGDGGGTTPVPATSNADVKAPRWSPAATGHAHASRVAEPPPVPGGRSRPRQARARRGNYAPGDSGAVLSAGSKSRRSRAASLRCHPLRIRASSAASRMGPCSARNLTMAIACWGLMPGSSRSSMGLARLIRTLLVINAPPVRRWSRAIVALGAELSRVSAS